MKIETTAEAFIAAMKLSLKPERKSTIPVLSFVRLDSGTITATDLDLTSIVPFESKGNGSFLVPYYQAMNVLTGETGPLSIEFKPANKPESGGKVTFKLTDCEYTLYSSALSNFPIASNLPTKPAITIDGATFRTLVDRTFFAIAREESRYTLNCAMVKAGDGKILMVTTDGHRLSMAEGEQATGKLDKSLIRSDAIDYLRTRVNGSVSIAITKEGDRQVFRTNGITLIARIITGTFPHYETVIPRDANIHATIHNPAKLLPVLTRVAKCADERSGAVKLSFGKALVLSASSVDRGTAKATFDCAADGEVEVGVNSSYISDLLKVAGDKPVTVGLKDNQTAITFSMENWQHIVMPMRL